MSDELLSKLKQISIFKEISDDAKRLSEIAKIVHTKKATAGSYVIEEGQEGDELYIISKGTVSIEKKTLGDEKYVVVNLKETDNAFFGELALLDKDLRSAFVQAVTDCEFYVINRDKFIKLGDEDPFIGLVVTREIAKILATRLRKANVDIITLFEALVEEVEEHTSS